MYYDIQTLANIGKDKVELSDSTKLLGVTIDADQKWSTHFSSLIGALNKRTFMIRRISNQIPKKKVLNVVYMSRKSPVVVKGC